MSNTKSGINSSTLKILALAVMLIDHIGAILVIAYMNTITDYVVYNRANSVYEILRNIGRVAFPIFVYQLVLGNRYTKDKAKHIKLLLIFTLISEIPFDLAFSNTLIDIKHQSTLWTLLIGSLMMCCLDFINREKLLIVPSAFTILVFCVITHFSRSDYGFSGIILVAVIYFFIEYREIMIYAAPVTFLIAYFIMKYINYHNMEKAFSMVISESLSTIAFLLIYYDNGVRKGGKALKWIGYLFYPAHLFILFLIKRLIPYF